MSLKFKKQLKSITAEERDLICSTNMCETCSIGYVDIKQGKQTVHVCRYHIMKIAAEIGEKEIKIQ